uniref:Non-specific serine/threonine protein kinase n=1 Tax=Rhabditophanes sp. KR3021 TaxID=114890 RepID=A0AC35TVH6_9BILA
MPSLITNKYVPNHRPNLNCPAVEDSRDLGLIFNKEPVENDYDILNDLGEGQYAKVRRVKHRTTGVHYAAKFVKKRRFATSRQGVPRPLIEREVQVLRLLGGHENVITLFDVYETSTEVIMILELVIGGELFDHVCEKECLPEVEAASFVKQILIGLRHLHQFNVVHLDVKPENIMLIRKGECKIKLIDFGLSRIIPPGTIVKDMIGTPEFVAPEVINYESLSSACDMWAVGVITYILLSNGSPFLGETREETFCNITGANYHLSDRYFGKVSEIAKDFIRNLLVVRQRKRLTVHEALEHPWIRGYFSVDCYQFKTPLSEISRSGKMLPSPKKTNKNLTAKEKWLKSFFKVRFINRLTIRTRTEIAKAKEAGVEMVHKYEEEEYIVSAVLIACEEGNYIGLEQLATRHEINLNVANKLGESSMHIAAGAGHDQVVLFLKSQGVPVNCQDRRGDTPLFWAARNGHAKIVRFLCRDKGVSINHVNKSGESALHVAARYAQITSLQTLLDCGANPNIQDETGESAMHIASWHGYSSALELLCKYKPNLHLNNQEEESEVTSRTPINFDDNHFVPSARDGSHLFTQKPNIPPSIKNGLGFPLPNKKFNTLFHTLTDSLKTNNSSEMGGTVEYKNAYSTAKVQEKRAAAPDEASMLKYASFPYCYAPTTHIPQLNLASIVKPSEHLEVMSPHNSLKKIAWEEEGSQDKMASQINLKAKREAWFAAKAVSAKKYPESARNVPLDYYYYQEQQSNLVPVEENHQSATEDIKKEYDVEWPTIPPDLTKSASAPTTERVNFTKRAFCVKYYPKTTAFVDMVMEMDLGGYGVKYDWESDLSNGCCSDDETALHCAAARGHLECVQCLLDDKAIVNARDLTGQTALHLALRRSHLDIAIVLITNSADIDIQDENGDTPLHIACRLGLGSTVQTLCHLQAKVDLKNNQSLTPLHIACAEEDIEIVRCLIVSKANVNCQTKDKQTAEDIAISKNNVEIASLLGKMKSTSNKNLYIDQLDMKDGNLKRIKLKIFGHCGTGKTKLVSAFANSGVINDFIGAVTKRFSDNLSLSPNSQSASASMGAISLHSAEEGYHSCGSSASSSMSEALHNNNLQKSQEYINGHSSIAYFNTPVNEDYTRGIDVQNINIHGAGEFSVWEFGGYEPYHIAYDHFVGNNECIHVVTFNSTEGPEIVYKQVLYWMNFLKGRVTQNEPIGHCGIVSKRSKVVLVGSHATDKVFPNKNSKGEYISSDLDAMLKTIKLRFETQFNIHDSLILLDSTNVNCNGMKAMKLFLKENREQIVKGLPPPLNLLDQAITFVQELRKEFEGFPVIPYSDFTTLLREEVNPLVSGSFSRRLVQQLQLIGEIVYLRDGATEIDLVILSPQWLGNHIIGQLFSAGHLSGCRKDGVYTIEEFGRLYPEISDPRDLLNVLDTLQLCVPMDLKYKSEYEFPGFVLKETPDDCWKDDKKGYVYGGMKIQPNRGMERSVQSFFPRIQAALRRSSIHDFHDPMDGDITQWTSCSKLNSGTMEAMIKLKGDAIEILVRGPPETDTSCFFFMEDIANMIEHTAFELCPGIPLERHFFSPKHLKEHRPHPATFGPEVIMQMQLNEQVSIKSSDDEEESFYDVVCFGSEVVASTLILGVDVSISNLKMASRCELASLLDPADSMGRDWSILAVKLNMTDQIESVDSTGQVLSRTDQLLCEWALHSPETATVGRLCTILAELGRKDARDALFRTVPLYSYSTLEELNGILPFEEENCSDSGVVSSTFSSREEPRSLSR